MNQLRMYKPKWWSSYERTKHNDEAVTNVQKQWWSSYERTKHSDEAVTNVQK